MKRCLFLLAILLLLNTGTRAETGDQVFATQIFNQYFAAFPQNPGPAMTGALAAPQPSGPPWSNFITPSRALDWTSNVGFTIPSYSTNCATQPSLLTGSGNASANASAIQTALASCDATDNVVNLPSGTYYVASFNFGSQGKQVLRGAGPNSTYLYLTGQINLISGSPIYNGNPAALPPSGSQQCLWTGGFTQGATSITLSSCGGTPPANRMMILDQANDSADTGGIFLCDTTTGTSGTYVCTYKGFGGGNTDGRVISSVTHSEQQVTYATSVTNAGGGNYTVTINPPLYFTNVRSGTTAGAWWSGIVQNDGVENLTLDNTNNTADGIEFYDCYQCWIRNIRSINAARAHVLIYQSLNDVVRDSYFYQSQSHSSVSYSIEFEESSGFLVENNIFQQVTNPIMSGQGSGYVVGYNFGIDNVYTTPSSYATASYAGHNAGNSMNLFEGNNFLGIWADDAWGTSAQITYFRNMLQGWQNGKTAETTPILLRAWNRSFNIVGNILGQPSYHTDYQSYATSGTTGVNLGNEASDIYSFGLADTGGLCSSQQPPCDSLGFTTAMRWGNYDVVNAATQWNSTEAAPGAVTYIGANFSTGYFGSLTHTLPASLYYQSQPSWWPSLKPWPPIGPDVSSGNVGMCSGTYAGAQAITSSQCTGGSLSTAWAGHTNSIPAQDCFLNVMLGPPDGTGAVLSFDANSCY